MNDAPTLGYRVNDPRCAEWVRAAEDVLREGWENPERTEREAYAVYLLREAKPVGPDLNNPYLTFEQWKQLPKEA